MAILQFKGDFTGQQIHPRFVHIHSTDTLSQVVAAGYINPYLITEGYVLYPTDFVFIAAINGNQIYKPVFGANNVITFTALP